MSNIDEEQINLGREVEVRVKETFLGHLKDWTLFEIVYVLLVCSMIVTVSYTAFFCISSGPGNQVLWIETTSIVAAVFGIVGTISATKRSKWNFLFDDVHVVLYAIIAMVGGYYGDVFLNLGYYLPIQLYAFKKWGLKLDEEGDTRAKKLTIQGWFLLFTALAGLFGFYYLLLNNLNAESHLYLDILSSTFSVTAMILMLNRYREQWVLYFIVNIVSVTMWVVLFLDSPKQNLYALPMIMMWSVYVFNSCFGFYRWHKFSKLNTNND